MRNRIDGLSFLIAETLDDFGYSLNDVFNILIGHLWVNGQGDDTLIFPVGNRKIVRFIMIFVAIIGMQVNGYKVDAATDISGFKFLDKLVTIYS